MNPNNSLEYFTHFTPTLTLPLKGEGTENLVLHSFLPPVRGKAGMGVKAGARFQFGLDTRHRGDGALVENLE
jgi:hypothetical protein